MAFLMLLASPLACAHSTTIEKLEYGRYRITCSDAPLDRCLNEAANNACDRGPYFVERGINHVNNRGPSELPDVALSSQAIVRCGPKVGWGDEGKALMSLPPPVSSAKPAGSVCAPGSTQECTGTAACKGGQACKEDGSGFQPCDCGTPAAAPVTAQPAAPVAPPAPVLPPPAASPPSPAP
jgi:hypothetical protein